MGKFYESFSFMLGFLILLNVFSMTLGSKFVEGFLLLVLAGMLLFNAEKIGAVFPGIL